MDGPPGVHGKCQPVEVVKYLKNGKQNELEPLLQELLKYEKNVTHAGNITESELLFQGLLKH